MQIHQTLTLLFFLLFSFCLTAQTRLFLDKNLMFVDSSQRFEYYQDMTEQNGGLTYIKLYKKDGTPVMQGGYKHIDQSGADLKKETFWYINGSYSYSTALLSLEEGTFRYFNGSKKPWYQVEFKNGKRDGLLASWYPSGASKRIEYFKNDVSQGGECYAEDGKPIAFTPFWQEAKYKKGPEALEKFLQSKIKYPELAYDFGQEGDVAVKLTVSADGKVEKSEEMGNSFFLLNREAVRVASLLGGWNAGQIDNVDKECFTVVTVHFRLADQQANFKRPPGTKRFDLIKDYIDTGKRFYINSERKLVPSTQPYVYQGEATSLPNGQMLITHYKREGDLAQKGVYSVYNSIMAVMEKSDSVAAEVPKPASNQGAAVGSFMAIDADVVDSSSAIPPSFPGGKRALFGFLSQNINYPVKAKENDIQGAVLVQFVIAKDGAVTDVMLLEDIGGGCGKEAIRIVKLMPRWIPGQVDGRPVRVRYTLPIRFKMD